MSDARRIAWCITDLDAGGAERALVEIVTRLPVLGWMPRVYCLSGPGELVAPLEAAGVTVECLGARSALSWRVVRRLMLGLRSFQPEVLQTFMYHANLAGRWAGCRARVPVIVSGLRVAERDAPWRMRFDRWTQRLVTHNVAVSQGVADFAVRECGLSAERTSVIPNGVDYERFANADAADLTTCGIPCDARVVTFIGRLHPQKAPELLLEALTPRLLADPRLHLLYVGEGPLREDLQRAGTARGVAARVHLIGHRTDVAAILKASTVCVLPSRWEGMPNVVLEAMAAGCPVIASDVEGSRELIESGRTGWLFARDSSADLQRILAVPLDDSAVRRQVADSAQVIVQQRFTWLSAARDYAALFSRLTSRRR